MTHPSVRWTLVGGAGCASLLGGSLWLAAAWAQPPSPPGPSHLTFSHSTAITNLYLPLSSLHQDVLAGTDEGHPARVERTARHGARVFSVNHQKVKAMIVEDRDFTGSELNEDTLDYFAQADDGTVYYMGESVDEYRRGKVVGHGGAWLTGEHNAPPGVLMPAHPKVGDKWQSEDVPGVTEESDEVLSVNETVTVPSGTYRHCVKVKEMAAGEAPEYKYYAPHVGVVREGSHVRLISHR